MTTKNIIADIIDILVSVRTDIDIEAAGVHRRELNKIGNVCFYTHQSMQLGGADLGWLFGISWGADYSEKDV